jgi:hypothetical protein
MYLFLSFPSALLFVQSGHQGHRNRKEVALEDAKPEGMPVFAYDVSWVHFAINPVVPKDLCCNHFSNSMIRQSVVSLVQ